MRLESDLLFELALCGRQRLFARLNFALGNGPCPRIPVLPERTAGMSEQELQFAFPDPMHQQTRADF